MKSVTIIILMSIAISVALNAVNVGIYDLDTISNKLSNYLIEDYEAEEQLIPILIMLNRQYDTQELYSKVKLMTKTERRRYTIKTLKEFSESSQRELKSLIEELKKDNYISEPRYFWLTNVIGMNASLHGLKQLSNHQDVRYIEYDPMKTLIHDNNEHSRDLYHRQRDSHSQRDIAENLIHINAPQVWDMGYDGQGVTVAVLDSGVNYNHNDIRNNMWTHPDYPNHGYNFFANNHNTLDDHNHGTFCAGVVAGDGSSGLRTGVAARTKIMALKVIGSQGEGTIQNFLDGMQFAVEYGADIMSISLSWYNETNSNRALFRDVAVNVLSAGVIVCKSAGNVGSNQSSYPIPRNIGLPGDCPPPWLSPDQTLTGGVSSIFTVGATDENDVLGSFSSRGPVTWQGVDGYDDYHYQPQMGLVKPDICAPGVDVPTISRLNTSGYISAVTGTSYSTPTVAGVMALMLSKNPYLLPEDLARIIEQSAESLSQDKSNNTGAGRIDALNAFLSSSAIVIDEVYFTEGNMPKYDSIVDISFKLKNISVQDNTNITGSLSTNDPYINVLSDEVVLGTIEVDSTVVFTDLFTIQIADNTPNNYIVDFIFNIYASETLSWENKFEVQIKSPDFVHLIPYIEDDEPGGNNNGTIDPGEEVTLSLPIENIGNAESVTLRVTLINQNDYTQIIGNTFYDFGNTLPMERIIPSFTLSIDENVDYGTDLNFSYTIESGSYSFDGELLINVGTAIPIQLGSGTAITSTTDPSPINVYFKSRRTQAVYTKEEINEAGVPGGMPISKIGYYIAGAPVFVLENFIIRMKHTTAVDASTHDEGPFETVYETDGYMPVAGGWDIITLDSPFFWNGVDNILVDTAFSPVQNWNSSGQIRYYNATNGFRYSQNDNIDQTNEPTLHINNKKPQMVMVFDTIAGRYSEKPQDLTAEQINSYIKLSWQASEYQRNNQRHRSIDRDSTGTRDFEGYNIYRNGIIIGNTEETEFIDQNPYENRVNFYYVTAVYNNRETLPSNIVPLTIEDTILPYPSAAVNPVPADNSTAVSVSLSGLQWSYATDDDSANPVGFRVYFSDSEEFAEEYEWVGYVDEQVDYTNSSILPSVLDTFTTYYWKVVPTTIDGGNDGLLANSRQHAKSTQRHNPKRRGDAQDVVVWSFTTQIILQAPELEITAETIGEDDYITLKWNSINGTQYYQVYTSTEINSPLSEWTLIETLPAGNNQYSFNTPTSNYMFYYIIATVEEPQE